MERGLVKIIAGAWKGRRIKTAAGKGYRPAMGRVREALFSMLVSRGVRWEQCRVLDVFAGSGSLGWEALSRGAVEVCFLENEPKVLRLLREQIPLFSGSGQRVRVMAGDALRTLSRKPGQGYDVLFFDPPYGLDLLCRAMTLAHENGWVAREGLVCAEVEAGWSPELLKLPEFALETDRFYGQTRILIWKQTSARNVSPSIQVPSIP
jgi:16S rRNA (guanine966-N2)-methyltransferase